MPRKRKAISKATRFEVFKRDHFTCQYCGGKAPDVVLVLDHIHPHSKGGTDEILNLITSCHECNSGKSDRLLSDNTAIEKQRAQMELLQERKDQIDMLFQWQKSLMEIDSYSTNLLAEYWNELSNPYSVNEHGCRSLRLLQKRFSMDEIMQGMKISADHYIKKIDGVVTHDSVNEAFNKVGGICHNRREAANDPNFQDKRYILGILRKRVYVNESVAPQLIDAAFSQGYDAEYLKNMAKRCTNWTEWREQMEEIGRGKLNAK